MVLRDMIIGDNGTWFVFLLLFIVHGSCLCVSEQSLRHYFICTEAVAGCKKKRSRFFSSLSHVRYFMIIREFIVRHATPNRFTGPWMSHRKSESSEVRVEMRVDLKAIRQVDTHLTQFDTLQILLRDQRRLLIEISCLENHLS